MSQSIHRGFQDGFIEIVDEQLKLCEQEVRNYDEQIERMHKQIDGLRAEREAAARRAQQLRDLLGGNSGPAVSTATTASAQAGTPIADADAVIELIRENGEPMHYIEIHQTLVDRGFEIGGEGKADTLLSRYFKDPRLVRVSRGTYDLANDEDSQTNTDVERNRPRSPLKRPKLPIPPTKDLNARMSLFEMIDRTLRQHGRPLHYREITERIQKSGVWQTRGKTPEASINSLMVVDINDNGDQSVFVREGRGIYGLREWREEKA